MLSVMVRNAALGLLILSGLVAPARADLISGSNIQSGNWYGGAYDANGRFSHCVVSSNYQSGVTLHFSVAANYTWRVGWSHANWQLNVGQVAPVSVWVDNAGPYDLQAKSVTNLLIAADLPYNNQTFELIRRGNRMTVRMPGGTYYFDLTGSSAALEQVVGCFNRYLSYTSPTQPKPPAPTTTPQPTPPQPSQPPVAQPPPSAGPTPEQRAAAKRALASIVGKAEMTGTRILDAEEVKSRNSAYLSASDVVWVDDATVGAMRVLPASATPLQGLVNTFIEADRKHCTAGLQSGNAQDERGSAVLRAHTTCQRDNGILEVRYIVVPRPDGTRYLFTTVGTVAYGAKMNRVRAGDAGLRQAIYAILRQ